VVFCLENSVLSLLGKQMGITVANEGYADCEHTATGSIIPIRTHAKSGDMKARAKRIVRMVKENKVITDSGEDLNINVQTICIHGDTEGAPRLLEEIHKELNENGISTAPVKSFI